MPLPQISQYKDNDDREDHLLYGLLAHGIGDDSKYWANELKKVFSYDRCELEGDFLGFTATYRHLSMIIPLHFTVVDFGCNHGCQAFYFKTHKKYIGIDATIPLEHRLNTPNSEHLLMSGQAFIESLVDKPRIESYPMFAISNYVPSPELNLLIRAKFPDLYVFYPKSKMPQR